MNSEPRQIYKEERDALLASVRDMTLLDGVFHIIHYNEFHRRLGPGPHCEPVDVFQHFANYRAEEIAAALKKVQAMRTAGVKAGDEFLNRKPPNLRVMEQLRAAHPGFGDKAYNTALDYGCFVNK